MQKDFKYQWLFIVKELYKLQIFTHSNFFEIKIFSM